MKSIRILVLRLRRRMIAKRIAEAHEHAQDHRVTAEYLEAKYIPSLERKAAELNGQIFSARYPITPRWCGSSAPERWRA